MKRQIVFLATLAFLSSGGLAKAHSATQSKPGSAVTTQLPVGSKPLHYALRFTPDVNVMTFQAHVDIDVRVDRPTQSLTLNAVDLKFGNVALQDAHGTPAAAVTKTDVRAKDQTVVVQVDRLLPKGNYRLSMDYEGRIGTQAAGLFALSYDTAEGKKKGLYTQFENSEARRFLPSWDEPNFKATFSLEAVVAQSDMAVSNMPVESKSDVGNGKTSVRFVKSPPMSTYLLFFGSGDFERATTQLGPTELGVITKRGSLDQAKEALEASKAILAEYNDYFGIPYPLPKLDNVAAPGRSQFFSAMENWGAIFTFENSMLIDPKIATSLTRVGMFDLAAHEIAHQWFGNLVTMQWWDDLWLNEGFASWISSRTTAKLHPEWNTHLYNVFTRHYSMQQDALKTTHPIVQRIKTVEQASQAFDGITYGKGQSVINMLEDHVGATVWRDGVRGYMKEYAYRNTRSDDFWAHITKASGQPVTSMAHDFTLQPGVPLIRVTDTQCKDGKLTLSLQQGEFSDDQPGKKPLRWRVPVTAQIVGSEVRGRTVVEGERGELTLGSCGLAVVNAGQAGYFRTVYGPSQFQALAKQFDQLPTVDQLGVMLDTSALGEAGLQPFANYLDLVQSTPHVADPQVWAEIASRLSETRHLFQNDAIHQAAFDQFAIQRLRPIMTDIGWDLRPSDAHSVRALRGALIVYLSELGDAVVIAEARRRFAAQDSDPTAMPPELRRTVLGVVARHASVGDWEKLHADARAQSTPLLKDMFYGLLAAPQDKALAQRALALALTDEVGETNSASMIGRVANLHPELAFDFAMAHYDAVSKKLDVLSRTRYFAELASNSVLPSTVTKIREYANKRLAPQSRRSAEEVIASIETRIKKHKRMRPSVLDWLRNNNG